MSNIINIRKFNGGFADSNYLGVSGSFGDGSKKLNLHKNPGTLRSQWSLTKDSGATVTDLIKYGFPGSDGNTYFGGDAGKIYKRTSGGTWSEEKDLGSEVLGMAEYNGYFYTATSNTLYRVAIASGIGNLASWETWTGNEISTDIHQMMYSPSGSLHIAAGQYISTVDSSNVWNSQGLDLPPDFRVTCLGKMADNTLVIGKSLVTNEAIIFPWDGYSDSFYTPTPVATDVIDNVLSNGRTVLMFDRFGKVFQFTGQDSVLIRQIPGDYTSSKYIKVHPQASAFDHGTYLIGVSNGDGNSSTQGVYRIGNYNNNYPKAVSLDYIISPGDTSGVDIGCIIEDNDTFYISWKETSGSDAYGVDTIDFSNYADGVYETPILGSNSVQEEGIKFKSVIINFEPLPASTEINVKYKVNGASSWTDIDTVDTTGLTRYVFNAGAPYTGRTAQFQVNLTSNGTDTPIINSILIENE